MNPENSQSLVFILTILTSLRHYTPKAWVGQDTGHAESAEGARDPTASWRFAG